MVVIVKVFVPDSACATVDLNVPVEVPVSELFAGSIVLSFFNSPVKTTVFVFPLVKVNVGFTGSTIFIIPVPNDSIVFNIPSYQYLNPGYL